MDEFATLVIELLSEIGFEDAIYDARNSQIAVLGEIESPLCLATAYARYSERPANDRANWLRQFVLRSWLARRAEDEVLCLNERRKAILAMETFGVYAVPRLVRFLTGVTDLGKLSLCRCALDVLAAIGPSAVAAIPAIAQLLHADCNSGKAVDALARIGGFEAVRELAKGLADTNLPNDLRWCALAALDEMGPPFSVMAMNVLLVWDQQGHRLPFPIHEPNDRVGRVAMFIEFLHPEHPSGVRAIAARILVHLVPHGVPAAVGPLIDLIINDIDPVCRTAAIRGLETSEKLRGQCRASSSGWTMMIFRTWRFVSWVAWGIDHVKRFRTWLNLSGISGASTTYEDQQFKPWAE